MSEIYYRKKPIIVMAQQWFKSGDPPEVGVLPEGHPILAHAIRPSEFGWIETLEGGHVVSPGDWIIRGVAGECYPCKPDIFEKTYESIPGLSDDMPHKDVATAQEKEDE